MPNNDISKKIDIFSKSLKTIQESEKDKKKETKETDIIRPHLSRRDPMLKTFGIYLFLSILAYSLSVIISAWLQNKAVNKNSEKSIETFSDFDISVVKPSDSRSEQGFSANSTSSNSTSTTTSSISSINKSSFKIRILNGNGVTGDAKKFKEQLATLGYSVDKVGNATVQTYATSQIYYKTGKLSEAELIKSEISDRKFEISQKNDSFIGAGYDILILIGKE